MSHRRLTDSEWVPQVSNRPLGGKCAVGERLTQSGAGVRRHSCMPSLALALLATLGSATAMADPLTCYGWLNANDSAVDNPYNATLIQLMSPDMPKEQVITRFIPELVRECSEQRPVGIYLRCQTGIACSGRAGAAGPGSGTRTASFESNGNRASRLGNSCTQAAIPITAPNPKTPPVKP